jgi:hypothetical protein
MFDNLPFETEDKKTIEAFIKSNALTSVTEILGYTNDGEQYTRKQVYKYFNLTFTISYSARDIYKNLVCRGSFHYLKNKGKHNADSLSFEDVRSLLRDFAAVFNVDLSKLKLKPYEIGVNIDCSPFDVTKVVQHTLRIERKSFGYNPTHIITSKISGSPGNDYRLKVYSKSHDLPRYSDPNNLRMELQFKKMRGSKSKKITTLFDLLEIGNWKLLEDIYFDKFNLIAVYDYTIDKKKVPKSKRHLLDYSNDNAWRNLVENCKTDKGYYTKYNDVLDDVNDLSKLYGSNLKNELLGKARQRWENFFSEREKPKYAPLLKLKHAPCIVCNPIRTSKFCIETGLDITMQRADSKYISNTGLKYLELNDPKTFLILKKSLLTGKVNKFEKDTYSMMSKQIRNRGGSRPPIDPNQLGILF